MTTVTFEHAIIAAGSEPVTLPFIPQDDPRVLDSTDALGIDGIIDEPVETLVAQFQSWRIKENDMSVWSEPDVLGLFAPIIDTDRVSKRVNGTPRKVRVVKGLKLEALEFIKTLKGEEDDVEALVAD